MLEWHRIQTVLLDMDGTLLDLHFDNFFWTEHIPLRYAERHHLSLDTAKKVLAPHFERVQGTLQWYCLDYWSAQLGMDVALLKKEVEHLIAVHPHVLTFLNAVRAGRRRAVLVTNAHMKSLELKLERTPLRGHLDAVYCSHDFGRPKEDREFWTALRESEPFDPATTLLVDDSLPVLRSARAYGIQHLLAVAEPDSRQTRRTIEEFASVRDFSEIMPPS